MPYSRQFQGCLARPINNGEPKKHRGKSRQNTCGSGTLSELGEQESPLAPRAVLPENGPTMQLPILPLRMSYLRVHGVTSADVSRASWQKSWYSAYNGSCVEVGRISPDRIGVRDTKDNGGGPILFFTGAEWDAFIAAAKSGQFDNP